VGESGDGFLQQRQPLPAELRRDSAEPGDVSAGACKARHEPRPDWIVAGRHHDRDGLSLSFDRRNHRIGAPYDHVRFEGHQLPREPRKSLDPGLAVANLENESLPFDVAKLAQPLLERLDKSGGQRWSARRKVPDLRDLGRLLRVDRRAGRGHGEEEGGDDARA
jgi:hypothetical protein